MKAPRLIHNRHREGSGKVVRFPGIGQAARALGVERTHLYRVLSGQRESRALLARYHALQNRRSA